jgi:sporulation protein YlmC with PRC-barrel domain
MNTPFAIAAALVAVAAVQAVAQSLPPPPGAPAPAGEVRFIDALRASEVTASELKGAGVHGSDDAVLGDISDLVLDSAGEVRAVVLSVGGVLGIGAKSVAVPFDALRIASITPGPGGGANRSMQGGGGRQDWGTYHRITLPVTAEQLKAAPAFSAARVITAGHLARSTAR